jgi:hypothetical protein
MRRRISFTVGKFDIFEHASECPKPGSIVWRII